MRTFDIICYLIACVCFVLAAISVGHPRVNLLAAGLFFWVLVPTVTVIKD
jgi:hypothetical protein